jgi:hypothetical protein
MSDPGPEFCVRRAALLMEVTVAAYVVGKGGQELSRRPLRKQCLRSDQHALRLGLRPGI